MPALAIRLETGKSGEVKMEHGIACGGNWIVDLVKVVDVYPEENSLANILGESMGGGGCAHNVTLDLAIFDSTLPLHAVGLIGQDPNGDFLMEECGRFPQINTAQLQRTTLEKTSYTDVFNVQSTGRRTFFHHRGANKLFSPEFVDVENISARMFHLGYLLLLDAMDRPDPEFGTVAARFLALLQKKGFLTSIDIVSEHSDRFSRIVPPALRYTNYCLMNDFESQKLTGIPIRENGCLLKKNLRPLAEKVLDYGVNNLVVIHFPEGAYLLTRQREEILQPALDLPLEYIVGTTGAGDSFCAGILYGLYQGWSHEKILRFAVCAGGMNLSDLTCVGGMRPWQEIMELELRFPYRSDVV
jgi:sugar/nucleoside kinase (ribokinase family)